MLWLFDTSDFATRDTCGAGWTHWLVALHVAGNLAIFAAYLMIPLALLRCRRWVAGKPEAVGVIPVWIFGAFAAFIVAGLMVGAPRALRSWSRLLEERDALARRMEQVIATHRAIVADLQARMP